MTLERRKLLIRTLPKASWSCSVWPDWAIYWTLGNFWSLWQQLICPNLPHSYGIFVRVSKSFIVLVKSFMANFYRHLAFFSGHNDHVLLSFFLPFRRWRKDLLYTRDRFTWLMTAHSFYACNGPLSTLMCRCMCVCVAHAYWGPHVHTLSLLLKSSVTRFGIFLPLWQKFTSLCQIFYG